MITQHTSVLAFETFVAPPVPVVTNDLAPGQSLRAWSPLTADTDLGRARRGPRGPAYDHRAGPSCGRLGRRERKEPRHRLHHPWSRRPLVRPWRHSRTVSEGSSRRHGGRGRPHAEPGVAEGIL